MDNMLPPGRDTVRSIGSLEVDGERQGTHGPAHDWAGALSPVYTAPSDFFFSSQEGTGGLPLSLEGPWVHVGQACSLGTVNFPGVLGCMSPVIEAHEKHLVGWRPGAAGLPASIWSSCLQFSCFREGRAVLHFLCISLIFNPICFLQEASSEEQPTFIRFFCKPHTLSQGESLAAAEVGGWSQSPDPACCSPGRPGRWMLSTQQAGPLLKGLLALHLHAQQASDRASCFGRPGGC